MRPWIFVLMMSVAGCLLQTAPVANAQDGQKERRLALLIGNQDYAKLRKLPAVPQEMGLIQTALKGAGFEITPVPDKDFDDLSKALDAFIAAVKPGDICVIYYSGYAAQDGADDYLLPVDFDPASATVTDGYGLTVLAKNLQLKTTALKMFFIEGARQTGKPVTGAQLGLRKPVDTKNLTEYLYFFPAAANKYIQTAPNEPGLFTTALAEFIKSEGSSVFKVAPDVTNTVKGRSNGQQEPVNDNLLTREFFFHNPPPPPPSTPPAFPQNSRDRQEYALIPAGTFLMGCVPTDTRCAKNEKPQHKVSLPNPFWLGRNEVTVAAYHRFIDDNKKKHKKPNSMPESKDVPENKKWVKDSHPITNMRWDDAVGFCKWAGGRLPSEAEWEYADRGGKQDPVKNDQVYPFDLANASNMANFNGNNDEPVRQYLPNPYGLFDMQGNVWEFVNDRYAEDYYASSPAENPQGPAKGGQHVRRGGSWYSDVTKHLRISVRVGSDPDVNVGFRCAMDDTSDTKDILQIK